MTISESNLLRVKIRLPPISTMIDYVIIILRKDCQILMNNCTNCTSYYFRILYTCLIISSCALRLLPCRANIEDIFTSWLTTILPLIPLYESYLIISSNIFFAIFFHNKSDDIHRILTLKLFIKYHYQLFILSI